MFLFLFVKKLSTNILNCGRLRCGKSANRSDPHLAPSLPLSFVLFPFCLIYMLKAKICCSRFCRSTQHSLHTQTASFSVTILPSAKINQQAPKLIPWKAHIDTTKPSRHRDRSSVERSVYRFVAREYLTS